MNESTSLEPRIHRELPRELPLLLRLRVRSTEIVVSPAPQTGKSFRSRRRRTAQDSRRMIVMTLGGFLFIQVILFALLEWVPSLRDPQFHDKIHQLQLQMNPVSGEKPFSIVVLGSSRTGMAVHGKSISEKLSVAWNRPVTLFNFGIPAVGPVLERLYLQRLLDQGIRPDLLLLEVHPALVTTNGGKPIELRGLFLEQLRHSELAQIQSYGYLDAEAGKDWAFANLVPNAGLRFPLLGRLLPTWSLTWLRFDWGRKTDAWGWNGCPWSEVTPTERAGALSQAKREYQGVLETLHFDTAAAQALKDLLELTRRENIPTKLLLLPEGETFRSWYPPEVEARLSEFLQSLETEYGVACLNTRTWMPEGAFMDSHHLMQPGAKEYSAKLGDLLLSATSPDRKEGGDLP